MRSLQSARADLEAHQRQLTEIQGRLAGLRALASAERGAHREHIASALHANEQQLAAIVRNTVAVENRAWDDPAWRTWQPRTDGPEIEQVATLIRAGHLRETHSGIDLPTTVGLGLIGRERPLVILSRNPQQQQAARALLQSLVVRAAALLPQRARFYLLDPGGQGAAFPMARHLGDALVNTANQATALDGLLAEIRRINHEYLDALVSAFHLVPEGDRQNERFRLVFGAGFPAFYDRRAIDILRNIAEAGSRAGVYTFVHHHVAADSSQQTASIDIPNAQVIDLARLERPFQVGEHEAHGYRYPAFGVQVVCDREPDPEVEREILARVARAARAQRGLEWADLGQPDQAGWWQGDATERIAAPIGRQGGDRNIDLTFGVNDRGQEIAHGLLVAMSGAGKTALLHTLITGLAVRYSPTELAFRLLDGKVGVEFRAYRDLPHAQMVSLNTRPELARSVLDDLVGELVRRNELFKRAGVNNFPAYRHAGSPGGHLPRLLLVADEYQILFEDDRDQVAAAALQRLSDQGRSAGIHLLLGSQHFAPANMAHRHDIFANFHLRLAMQMVPSELLNSIDFGSEGKRLIRTVCVGPGKVVVSDRPGDDSNYQAGSTAYLDPRRRDALVRVLSGHGGSAPRGMVLDGDRQPELGESRLLPALARGGLRGAPRQRQAFAREVLGEDDWIPEEHPLALVLGLPFTVGAETVLVLRRRSAECVGVISPQAPERTGIVASALLSACLQLSPDDLQIAVADRSLLTADGLLQRTVEAAKRAGYLATYGSDDAAFDQLLAETAGEIERRSRAEAVHEPVRLVVLNEPNRVPGLMMRRGRYGDEASEQGKVLDRILEMGPPVGVHSVLALATVGALAGIFDVRRANTLLQHRVVMQMSEKDSFATVHSNAAARLQADGPRPIAALLFDQQEDRETRFRPWALEGLPETLEQLVRSLP